jgi:hypothetical protein
VRSNPWGKVRNTCVACNCLDLDNFEQGLEGAPLVGNHLDRSGKGTLGPFPVLMEVVAKADPWRS